MATTLDDDLFKNTTMTFGEHLEELRSSLFRAVLSLVVGFAVGLWFGDWVVKRIQDPLKEALEDFYVGRAVDRWLVRIVEREKNGEQFPPEFKDRDHLTRLIQQDRLLFEDVYLAPDELLKALKGKFPKAFEGIELPKQNPNEMLDAQGMLRIFLWHRVEDDDRLRVKGLSAQEAFMIWMKAAFVTGVIVASPLIFYFLWEFVAAGLYPHEKRYVHVFLPFSLFLFLAGAALAFFFVFKPVLAFFFSFNSWLEIDPDPRISEWLSFVLMMPLAFGISFQLPLVMLFLERIGIFDMEAYLAKWRVAILVIAVVSMVLSPGGDPYSMMLMLIPLVFLYFGGIGLCKWLPSSRNPYDEGRAKSR